jgi:hypothetical protein
LLKQWFRAGWITHDEVLRLLRLHGFLLRHPPRTPEEAFLDAVAASAFDAADLEQMRRAFGDFD